MNRRPYLWLAVGAVFAVAVSACSSSPSGSASGGGKPLIAEPTTGVTFSQDFNPYDTNSVSSSMGTRTLVNEPLVEYDQLDATDAGTHYWLATAYAFQKLIPKFSSQMRMTKPMPCIAFHPGTV